MVEIKRISAREILDSRANPTLLAEVELSDGTVASASVPSGASTGQHEALELRDGDGKRYNGKGVLKAVERVNEMIAPALIGAPAYDNIAADSIMIALDGSINKSNLGANSILSVSLALLRAAASSLNIPLYRYVGGAYRTMLPIPMMNILNGGAHSSNNVDVQEFMIVPFCAESFSEALRIGVEVYHSLMRLLKSSSYSVGVGDEGGFAPSLEADETAIAIILEAIERAGFKAGEDVALALDVAASEWYDGKMYRLPKRGVEMSSAELTDYIAELISKYPIISVEDALADTDFVGWKKLSSRLSAQSTMLVGDDLFVTDKRRIEEGALGGIANAVLIKPNQIGTVSEAAEAIACAHSYGYKTIMSHRSGETEDTTIADLAVGLGTRFIKTGAPARGERVCKYNRLLQIEAELFSPGFGY